MSCRVTVVGSKRRVDAALPDSVPIAELLSDVVEMLGETPDGAAVEWGLVRVGGPVLDPELSLADQGVAEGTMLFLRDLVSAPAAPSIDDFAGRVAVEVDAQRGHWTEAMAPAVLACVAGASLAGAGLAVLLGGDPRARALAGSLGAVISVALGIALVRLSRRQVLAAVVVFCGLAAWAAAGVGLAGLAGANPTELLAAGLGAAALGALAAIAIVGDVAFAPAEAMVAATGIPAVVIGATDAFGGTLLQAAAVLTVIELVFLALLPPLNVRLIGLTGAESSSLVRRLMKGRRLQAASLIGTGVAIIAACSVLAVSDGWFARALVGVTALAVSLRARHYRFAAEVAPLLAAGLVSLILLELRFLSWLPALLIADAVVLGAAATLIRRWTPSPQIKQWLRPLEGIAIAASVPLALGLLGLYDAVVHVARGLV